MHLVWVDATVPAGGARGKVMYATRAVGATIWTIREIDSALFGDPFTTTASLELVLDSVGNPHVAWVHYRTKELRFARWDGGAWARMDGTPGHDVLDTDVDYTSVGLIRFGGQFDYAACLSVNCLSNSAGLT
ncbi:MAG TPA: hypothetical protein VLU43_18960 [Anaeromyxobacteraceae bacterium]|nr:hypothetical protein [Anaeromyxobacteraceae bacterium]